MSLGVIIQDVLYEWSEDISESAIAKRVANEGAKKVVSATLFILIFVFFFLGALSIFLNDQLFEIFDPVFWFTPSFAGSSLSFAGLLAGLLFSHQVRSGNRKAIIPKMEMNAAMPSIEEGKTSKKQVNIADLFDPTANSAVESAFSLAKKFEHEHVEPLHLFIGGLDDSNAQAVFSRLGLNFDKIKDPLSRRLVARQRGTETTFSEQSVRILLESFLNAYEQQRQVVSGLEIFFEAFKQESFIQELLIDNGVTADQFANMVEWVRIHEKMRERYEQFGKAAAFKPTGPMNRAMTSVATPLLDAFSEDLTTAGVNGRLPLLIGREKELNELFRVIEGGRQSVVLVGPEGVGKTALLSGVAQLMIEERVPAVLQDKRLVRLSIPHLVSGASPGEAQDRLLQALNEVVRSGNIVLAVSDIEQMTGISSGQGESVDLAATFVDFLSRSGTFAIATTSPRAYTAAIEGSILGRVFQKVDIQEPSEREAIYVLESKVAAIEYEHNVIFSYAAIEKCIQLTDRYMHESYLPKKAINVAQETALHVAKSKGEGSLVTDQDIAQIVSEKTNVPLTSVNQDEKDKLINLESMMHERVIGQVEAVSAVSAALRRARTDLRSGDRPIAAFLFLGPTGVGKTELAKTIAATYFGDQNAMVRLDMSEYQDTSSIAKLVGSPNSTSGGFLTEAVRKNPFTIVLLDEFEKANKDVLNLFLQVFDDGRLTDSAGRVIDFTNTVLIATSNAGTEYIQEAVARNEDLAQIKNVLIEEKLKTQYRPELLNRFDGVIVFTPLSQDEIIQIAHLMIAQVANRLDPKGISFRADDEVVQELAKKGYDPKFGARPLRRVIQEEVDNAIANALLEGNVKRRDTIVLEKGGIRIEKAAEL